MSNEEFKYFRKILWGNKGVFHMASMRLRMYFEFKRLPSEEEMHGALDRYNNNLRECINYIMDDRNWGIK